MSVPEALLPLFSWGYYVIAVSPEGKLYAVWLLTPYQKKFFGHKISPITCAKKVRLCGKKLKRVHLTCFKCELRRVVSGEKDIIYPIALLFFPMNPKTSTFRKFLIKNLLSIAEFLR